MREATESCTKRLSHACGAWVWERGAGGEGGGGASGGVLRRRGLLQAGGGQIGELAAGGALSRGGGLPALLDLAVAPDDDRGDPDHHERPDDPEAGRVEVERVGEVPE